MGTAVMFSVHNERGARVAEDRLAALYRVAERRAGGNIATLIEELGSDPTTSVLSLLTEDERREFRVLSEAVARFRDEL